MTSQTGEAKHQMIMEYGEIELVNGDNKKQKEKRDMNYG